MSVQAGTDTVRFKNAKGQANGASFTIRSEPTYDGYTRYLAASLRVGVKPTDEELQGAAKALVEDMLLSVDGVFDTEGQPATKETIFRYPAPLVRQVVAELQRRANAVAEPSPNSSAPSGKS